MKNHWDNQFSNGIIVVNATKEMEEPRDSIESHGFEDSNIIEAEF